MLIAHIRRLILLIASKVSWLAPTLTRIVLGLIFVGTGWGKLHDLDKVTEYFGSLGIPFPGFNATLAATTELVGGTMILLGLLARVASVPLIFTMCVAIATAKWSDLESVGDFFKLDEFIYIVLFLWIAVVGPGPLSIDHVLAKRFPVRLPKKPVGTDTHIGTTTELA
jgi:putative oxidoreductase